MIQQASARQCFVCGVENESGLKMRFFETETDPVQVSAEYTVPKRFEGYPGIVHGGIIAAMLDEVTSRTVMRGDPPRFAVTAQLSIRYRKPVPVDTPLKLTGRMVKDTGRVITVSGEITDPDGVVLAESEATLVQVEQSFFGAMSPLDAQGWRVYPDDESTEGGAG